jgi:hypothetical protein
MKTILIILLTLNLYSADIVVWVWPHSLRLVWREETGVYVWQDWKPVDGKMVWADTKEQGK